MDVADLLNVVSLTSLSSDAATQFIRFLFDIFLLVCATLLFALSTALNTMPKLSETKFYPKPQYDLFVLYNLQALLVFLCFPLFLLSPSPSYISLQMNCISHLAALVPHLSKTFIAVLLFPSK